MSAKIVRYDRTRSGVKVLVIRAGTATVGEIVEEPSYSDPTRIIRRRITGLGKEFLSESGKWDVEDARSTGGPTTTQYHIALQYAYYEEVA